MLSISIGQLYLTGQDPTAHFELDFDFDFDFMHDRAELATSII